MATTEHRAGFLSWAWTCHTEYRAYIFRPWTHAKAYAIHFKQMHVWQLNHERNLSGSQTGRDCAAVMWLSWTLQTTQGLAMWAYRVLLTPSWEITKVMRASVAQACSWITKVVHWTHKQLPQTYSCGFKDQYLTSKMSLYLYTTGCSWQAPKTAYWANVILKSCIKCFSDKRRTAN